MLQTNRSARYALVLLLMFAVWSALAQIGALTSLFFPSPAEVWQAAQRLSPSIQLQMASTAGLVVLGYFAGLAVAGALSAAFLLSRTVASIIGPITDILRGVPPVCLIPFFILWFGFQPSGKISLVALNVTLIVYPALVAQFESSIREYAAIWRSLGRKRWELVIFDGLRSSAMSMLPTYRFGLAFSVMLAVISEAMGATQGLGHIITVSLSTFSLAGVVAASLAAAVLAASLDLLLVLALRALFPWLATSEPIL
jgi:ABC-type nitrate/sulfonate/bicarbonate transport system permease component